MKGTFFVIGAGPGDPELLTLKAQRVLKECRIWFTPSAFKSTEKSTAYDIAATVVSPQDKLIISHHFPMQKIHRKREVTEEIRNAWQRGAKTIMEHLDNGENVAFPTLGDPAIYSTAFYILETLQEFGAHFPVKIIPGVASINATAAEAQLPLCLGDEHFVVIPAVFESDKAKELLQKAGAAAFMKAGNALPHLIPILDELGIIDDAVLIERCGLEGERIWRDIRLAEKEKLHYFSTLIVRSKGGR